MHVDAPGFLGGDRTRLDLPANQQRLLERVVAVGTPTVLVLMNGSALSVNWADRHVPAIIEAWYPGGQGGEAVARLIAGDFSPAGRLPVTFYASVDQLPDFNDYSMANRTYRYFDGEALYPFGYGLSFTHFAYDNPEVTTAGIDAESRVTVTVDITNDGAMDGDEVAQLYLSRPGVAGAPIRAFNRLSSAPIGAAFTIIAASVVALRQQNLKRLLAYSTVAQLSYVVMATAILKPLAEIGAAAADQRARTYEAAILKTLGATRARILTSLVLRAAILSEVIRTVGTAVPAPSSTTTRRASAAVASQPWKRVSCAEQRWETQFQSLNISTLGRANAPHAGQRGRDSTYCS